MISSELRPSPLGPKRKYYSLTAEGEAYLQEFIKCWTEVQSSVNRILKKEGVDYVERRKIKEMARKMKKYIKNIPTLQKKKLNQMIEDISYNNAKNFFKF